jgi:hypothetical protein
MKDHPDEFLMQRKWDELINEFGGYFTEEELNAYKVARSEMMRDLFNEAVLKRLAGEEDDGKTLPSTMKYGAQERYSQGWTDPRAMLGQSLMNTPSLAAKQANAARQQEAYAAMQQSAYNAGYSEQRGLQKQAYNDIGFNPFV